MLSKSVLTTVMTAALMIAPIASQAETTSPVFGSASVIPTTKAQNEAIVGKGYYADTYGSYGVSFATAAVYYGQYGDYNAAAAYASYAYYWFNAAADSQAFGY